jgi:hypothetical protein
MESHSQDVTQQEEIEEEEEEELHDQMSQDIEEHYEPIVAKQEIEQYLTYETTLSETISTQDESSYQKPFEGLNQKSIKESQELDSWLAGVKQTLLVSLNEKTHSLN